MKKNRRIGNDMTVIIPTEKDISAVEWLAEQMPGGFFIYRADDAMELLYVNYSTCVIFGCETVEEFRELTGNTFRGMVHPEDFDTIQASIDDQIANAFDEDVRLSLEAGMNAHLSEPVDPDALFTMLEDLISEQENGGRT